MSFSIVHVIHSDSWSQKPPLVGVVEDLPDRKVVVGHEMGARAGAEVALELDERRRSGAVVRLAVALGPIPVFIVRHLFLGYLR